MISRSDTFTQESNENSLKSESHSVSSDKFLPKDHLTDTSCGLDLPFRTTRFAIPQLQRFASTKCALGLLSLAYLFSDGIANGVFVATISTVERQFQLRTTETGLIGAMMDIGSCIALSVIVYFGESITKARWIACGMLSVAAGSLIFVIPQFVAPDYTFGEEEWNYCGNVSSSKCEGSPLRKYRYIFMIATFFLGSGAECVATLPLSYLDENVKQTYSSFYHGILNSFGAFGPASGYLLAGVSLRFFNEPMKRVHITQESSLWVGAWWICFIGGAVCLLLLVLPLLLLPRNLPGAERARHNREQKRSSNDTANMPTVRIRILSLLTNKLYIAICVSEIFHASLVYGFLTYSVKIGVDLYGMTESTASFALGSVSIASTVLGYFLGGALITKFKMTLKVIIRFMIICTVVSLPFSLGYLIYCPSKNLATINANGTSFMNGHCNRNCQCDMDKYNPVCDDHGAEYFSPCHAGCMKQINLTDAYDCACVSGNNISSTVSTAKCASSMCKNFPAVIALLFVCFFGGFLTVTPSTQATLRSVGFNERTMAISAQRITQIVLGRIVGRLVFAKALESACLVSSTECQERGACRSYDVRTATTNLAVVTVTGKLLILLSLCCAAYLVKQRELKKSPKHLNRTVERDQTVT